ncbi:MAG: twin-arginine translocation signal domain-containing protein [Betaproteobacteria bacterium]|nr:twin-arginine translocation signal domain-containing protein [Betaproteobacteria bacterium]
MLPGMLPFIFSGHIMDNPSHEPGLASRRNFMGAVAAAAGGLAAVGGGLASPPAQAQQASAGAKKGKAVALNWKEVYFTNCPMVSANNIDQELGWCKTDFKAIGIDYSYFRSRRETDWYPHYIHNQDNLIRFGGLYPPIHVQADIRRTRLLGATWVHEGGAGVRAGMAIRT